MKSRYALSSILALTAIAAPANAAIIAPVSVQASSTFWTYDVNNLINGSGLSASIAVGKITVMPG